MGNTHSFSYPIYCINLATSVERKRRMISRFKKKILNNITFVSAIPLDSPLIDYYKGDSIVLYDIDDPQYTNQHEKDISCFASHIKSIRQFLEDNNDQEYGLICEDDILFSNNFHLQIKDLTNNLPDHVPVLSLTYMISGPIDQTLENRSHTYMGCANIFNFKILCYRSLTFI